jgi:WD40 repeat protein
VWNLARAEPVSAPLKHDTPVEAAAFSPDGSRIVTAGDDGPARLWDLAAGPTLVPALGEGPGTFGVQLGPSGATIAGTADRFCAFWDHEGRRIVSRRNNRTWGGGRFSPDERSLLFTSKWGNAIVLSARLPEPLAAAQPDNSDYPPVTDFSADGRLLLTLNSHESVAGKVRIWDLARGELLRPFLDQADRAGQAWISPDGSRVVTLETPPEGKPFLVRLYDTANGRLIATVLRSDVWSHPVLFHPSQPWFLVEIGGERPVLSVFDAATGKPLREGLDLGGPCQAVVFGPDDAVLLAAGTETRIWDSTTWQARTPPLGHHVAVGVNKTVVGVFSPDGRRFAGPCEDGRRVRIWDARTGDPATPPLQLDDAPRNLRFSRDGRLLLTLSEHSVRLWDVRSGEAVTPAWPANGGGVFTPDCDALLSVSGVGPALRWDLRPAQRTAAEWRDLALVLANRQLDATGGNVLADRDTFRAAWGAVRNGRAGDRAASPEQRHAWHWRSALACGAAGFHVGQLLHLDRLRETESRAAFLCLERGQANLSLRRWTDAEADFTRALDLGSDRLEAWQGRAHARAMQRRWRAAARDVEHVVVAEPNQLDYWRQRAALLLLAGDREAYHALCAKVLASPGLAKVHSRESITWVCLLGRDAVADPGELLRRFDQNRDWTQAGHPEELRIYSAALLRGNRAAEALPFLRKVAETGSDLDRALTLSLLALAAHAANKPDEANKARSAADQLRASLGPPQIHRHEWLELEVLHAEVEQTLGKR